MQSAYRSDPGADNLTGTSILDNAEMVAILQAPKMDLSLGLYLTYVILSGPDLKPHESDPWAHLKTSCLRHR